MLPSPVAYGLGRLDRVGQTEIKDYMKDHGPSTVKELSNSLELNPRGVRESLRSMEKWGEVKRTNTQVAYQADIWGLPEQIEAMENNESEQEENIQEAT